MKKTVLAGIGLVSLLILGACGGGNKTDDNMYSVKKADSDVIYKINSDKISVFTDATLFSLTNPRIYATDEGGAIYGTEGSHHP